MSPCPRDKTLSRYVDGELGAAATERVRRHLEDCESCARRYGEFLAVERALQAADETDAESPDVASRVTGELRRRGAFFRARVAEGKRRIVGQGLRSWQMGAALAAAVGIVLIATAGMDAMVRWHWVRRTEPVLADAERILVRLVYVAPSEEERRLAWARDQARELDLPKRLGEARSAAEPVYARDLVPLEQTFTLLARGEPLPAGVAGDLSDGHLLGRACRLRETLARGG